MADSFPYTVTDPAGEVVLQAAEGCRYSRRVELSLLEAGIPSASAERKSRRLRPERS